MHIKNFDPFDFKKKEINGVPVYYKNIPWAPCIHLRVLFNFGAFSDPAEKEGTVHFLEHMFFKGSDSFFNEKAIKEWSLKNTLNTFNAYTSLITTCFTLKCLPEKLELVLSDLVKIIFNPLLRKEDFDVEKKTIIAEAWNNFSNEKYIKYIKEINNNLFYGTPREKVSRALGWPDTIENIQIEDVEKFFIENYNKQNICIVVAGNINEDIITDSMEEFIKQIPHGDKKLERIIYGLNKPKINKIVKMADEIGIIREQSEFSFKIFINNFLKKNIPVSGILVRMIRHILYEKLRIDHGISYNVNVSVTHNRGYTSFSINLKTNNKDISFVEDKIISSLSEIKEDILSNSLKGLFENMKKASLEQIEAAELLTGDIVNNIVDDITTFNEVINRQNILQKINSVSFNDLKKVTEFISGHVDSHYIEIILPSKKENEKK